ncbi:MAG: class I SAM-dependent methyltransferase [Phycisphaerales bacterium]|nr:class I SAM-dependent methyltransferase [Phycisphaerales bacterium]
MMTVEHSTADHSLPLPTGPREHAALVRRVNQLYHELTGHAFDNEHRYRHRVERSFWQRVARQVLCTSSASKPRVIIDLACGTGFVSEIWRPYLKGTDSLIALDLGLSTLQSARSKWINNDHTPAYASYFPLAGDGASLPLANESVDLVGINAALHHVPDPVAALREIDRVLRPGGYFALGFEPNHTHFGSYMNRMAKGMDRLVWYTDIQQNRRRLRAWLAGKRIDTSDVHEDTWVATLNTRLIAEGYLPTPLNEESLLNLVDPHARGAGPSAGFDAADLLRRVMPGYEVCRLTFSDYLGLGIRRLPTVRTIVDKLVHAALPEHGSLFSWLIRKNTGWHDPTPCTGTEGGQC